MKFRKINKENATTGAYSKAVGWTKSSSTGNGGCAILRAKKKKTDSSRKQIENELKRPHATTADDLKEATTSEDVIDQEGSIAQQKQQQEEGEEEMMKEDQVEESVVPPKPKPIQYTIHEKVAPPKRVVKYHLNKVKTKIKEDGEDSSDQSELFASGILSFEDVILPSVAFMENEALKQMQRKIQRDSPDQTHIVVAARVAVSKSLGAASQAAKKSRLNRRVLDQQLEQKWSKERHVKREENRKERSQVLENKRIEEARRKEMQSIKLKRESQKKFLPNQELWREVAYLMTESSKLERESRLWNEAETILDAREKDIEAREAEAVKGIQQEEEMHTTLDVTKKEHNEDQNNVPMNKVLKSTENIITSSNEIQAALKLVTDLMLDSAKLRKDLYRRYRQDHQFEGYRGVNDPKGLIRILSQDDA